MDDSEKSGIEKRNIEIAKQMLAEDESWDKITRSTGLTKEELEKLSQQH